MEVIQVSTLIQRKIKGCSSIVMELENFAKRKAETSAEYVKEIAKTMMQLKQGKDFILDNIKIFETKTTNLKAFAKGICYKQQIEMDLADAEYKIQVEKVDVLKAQLNGYQSIHKHLGNVIDQVEEKEPFKD